MYDVGSVAPDDSKLALAYPEEDQPVIVTFEHEQVEFSPDQVGILSKLTHDPDQVLSIRVEQRGVQLDMFDSANDDGYLET